MSFTAMCLSVVEIYHSNEQTVQFGVDANKSVAKGDILLNLNNDRR